MKAACNIAFTVAGVIAAGTVAWLYAGGRSPRELAAKEDKKLREHLTDRQVDKMLMDTFPASDPPSTY